MQSLAFVVAALLIPFIQGQIQIFPNGTQSTVDLTQGCTSASTATIACEPYIQRLATDYYGSLGNATLQNTICAAGCGSSLASYHARVAAACASAPQPWPGIPVWAGDVLWATYNRTFLKDPSTGRYCVGK